MRYYRETLRHKCSCSLSQKKKSRMVARILVKMASGKKPDTKRRVRCTRKKCYM